MKIFTLTQATKQHNSNALHDAFILAGITPQFVESTPTETRASFDDAVTTPSIQAVVNAYVYAAPAVPANWVTMYQNYRTAVTNATTLAQCKTVLNGELCEIIKALAKDQIGNL
jgi:hypothetical protein